MGTDERFDFYVRQLRDMKSGFEVEDADVAALGNYAVLCGTTLAGSHARSGEPSLLAGYLGTSPAFDEAMVAFATAYADQTERDYEGFVSAVRGGHLHAVEGR